MRSLPDGGRQRSPHWRSRTTRADIHQERTGGHRACSRSDEKAFRNSFSALWFFDHGHGPSPATPWALLSPETVLAIVDEAHARGRKVTAHIGENAGARLALDAVVDEWAHVPCAAIDDDLLQRAVDQGVRIVTAIDTLSSCTGFHANTIKLGELMQGATSGAEFLYGSEICHDNVPWGINEEEPHLMLHLAGMAPIQVSQAATSKAGLNLGVPRLGTLQRGAPVDIIAVRGNPFERFKLLEYPDRVISGGHVLVNRFRD